jgi:hypothetical protein
MTPFEHKFCADVTIKLMNEPISHLFLDPVDEKFPGCSTYYQEIKQPMDLKQVMQKLANNRYQTAHAWRDDMRLIWRNAMTFNRKGSLVYLLATKLSEILEQECVTFPPTPVSVWHQNLREAAARFCTIMGSFDMLDRPPDPPDPPDARDSHPVKFRWVPSVFECPGRPSLDYRIPLSDSE